MAYNLKHQQIMSATLSEGVVTVNISTNKHPALFMLCDFDDFKAWAENKSYGRIFGSITGKQNYPYAAFKVNGIKRKSLYFHQIVMTGCLLIDHENRIGTDNRKQNLSSGEMSVNQRNQKLNKNNRSGFRGIHWIDAQQNWRARISVGGKTKYLGNFYDINDAIKARHSAEITLWGKCYE